MCKLSKLYNVNNYLKCMIPRMCHLYTIVLEKKITIGIETRIFGNACFVQANYKNILIYNFASLNEFYYFAEYLCVFSHLIAFHDPELGNHLEGIGFIPDVSYIN